MLTDKLKHILLILLISLLIKFAYLIFAYYYTGDNDLLSVQGYATILNRNDTGWYQRIAENWYPVITNVEDIGYNDGKANFKQSEWAFLPFYPWMNRVLMLFFNFPFNTSGLILSILLSSLAFTGFYLFSVYLTKNSKKSLYSTLIFILFPFHYYFSMMYSEAAFFTFLIFTFIAVQKRKYLYVPFLIIPLVLTRPFGLIALIAVYLFYLEKEGLLSGYHFRFKEIFSKKNIGRSLIFITGPLAFLAYCYYQYQMTGEFFAFSIAQAGWYRKIMFPVFAFFRSGDFATQFNSFYTIGVIIFSLMIMKRNTLSINVFIFLSLLLPLISGSVGSMTRFVSVIFPFTLFIGFWLYESKLKYPVLFILAALQLYVFHFWLIGDPFSF